MEDAGRTHGVGGTPTVCLCGRRIEFTRSTPTTRWIGKRFATKFEKSRSDVAAFSALYAPDHSLAIHMPLFNIVCALMQGWGVRPPVMSRFVIISVASEHLTPLTWCGTTHTPTNPTFPIARCRSSGSERCKTQSDPDTP